MSKLTKISIAIICLAIIGLSFGIGFAAGSKPVTESESGISAIEEAWNIIHNDYVDKSMIDDDALKNAAIAAMVEELADPYTAYLETQDYELSLTDLEGQFDGIGAYVGIDENDNIHIIAPISDSPADKAGIRAGDIILKVNGESIKGLSLAEVILRIRGEQGTSVTLLVQHEDEPKPVEITIVRDTIHLDSVELTMEGNIAHILITQFTETTDDELADVLEQIKDTDTTGIILDLRYNPGGLLNTLINVASQFIPEGKILDVVHNDQTVATLQVVDVKPTTDLPIVVLVNEFSASASEVLSGALQDHQRAIIAGSTTYGKGSVNILREMSDGSGIYITTARWLTPNGKLIEGEGITPDYILNELDDVAILDWALDYFANK